MIPLVPGRAWKTYHRPGNRQTIDDVLEHSIIKKLHKGVSKLDIVFANLLHSVIKPHLIRGYTTTGSMLWVRVWLLWIPVSTLANATLPPSCIHVNGIIIPETISCSF